jgi:predicted Rossmann fold flavoprotein
MLPMANKKPISIAIIGGGAAGFFCAINAAKKAKGSQQPAQIVIFESGSQLLKKVRISGGGRCNVTHNIFEVNKFCENYPRGKRELLSPMNQFQAKDTIEWFADLGVKIIPESDGRMFPDSNSSETIINTYIEQCETLGVEIRQRWAIKSLQSTSVGRWRLTNQKEEVFECDKVLIATGSGEGGYKLATSVGHKITERAPSLFTFKISHPLLEELQGLSFPGAQLKLKVPPKNNFKQEGPILITHWGLSGPAVLKLSAWAAREMKNSQYNATLSVDWIGSFERPELIEKIETLKNANGKSLIKNVYPEMLPKRFWYRLLDFLAIDQEKQWANITKKEIGKIIETLKNTNFEIRGQSRFKEEFVECGGVALKEINFKSMESKKAPGIYFAGEILDIDGITGGFNFQNAWTTAWIAAQNMIP